MGNLSLVPLFLFTCVISLAHQNPISPDTIKLYHDITSGKGLYTSYDKVNILNATDFKATVFNESYPRAWIVEFYNSWCGHCVRFAPTWKAFASDIAGWKDTIAVGAVDCSNTHNTPLCRDYEVMFYPMIKYFSPPSRKTHSPSSKESLGTAMRQESVTQLREAVVHALEEDKVLRPHIKGSSLNEVWAGAPEAEYGVVVVGLTAGEMVLDLARVSNVIVRSVSRESPVAARLGGASLLGLVKADNSTVRLNWSGERRSGMYTAVSDWLHKRGVSVPPLGGSSHLQATSPSAPPDIKQAVYLMQVEQQIKHKLHLNQLGDVVFQVDIEKALNYCLSQEIPAKKLLTGSTMAALKDFLSIVIRYFPTRRDGVRYLKRIQDSIKDLDSITGADFGAIVVKRPTDGAVYLSPQGWLGCRGSRPHFRGFPCGLWQLFHTLTVQALHANTSDPKSVLYAMRGYIKNFFGCAECAEHFSEMARTIDSEVFDAEGSVVWLWASHNKVNARLAGDKSEDPNHPKLQFPTKEMCPNCSSGAGKYSKERVVEFLERMYTSTSYLSLDDLPPPPPPLPLKVTPPPQSLSYFSLNLFDLSLCLLLYASSITIILLVSIKFFLRKTYRKKLYLYDLFNKV